MIVEAMKGYRAADLPKDAVAGLVIAALSIPIAMGYAEVVGLPAIYGLWASIVAPAGLRAAHRHAAGGLRHGFGRGRHDRLDARRRRHCGPGPGRHCLRHAPAHASHGAVPAAARLGRCRSPDPPYAAAGHARVHLRHRAHRGHRPSAAASGHDGRHLRRHRVEGRRHCLVPAGRLVGLRRGVGSLHRWHVSPEALLPESALGHRGARRGRACVQRAGSGGASHRLPSAGIGHAAPYRDRAARGARHRGTASGRLRHRGGGVVGIFAVCRGVLGGRCARAVSRRRDAHLRPGQRAGGPHRLPAVLGLHVAHGCGHRLGLPLPGGQRVLGPHCGRGRLRRRLVHGLSAPLRPVGHRRGGPARHCRLREDHHLRSKDAPGVHGLRRLGGPRGAARRRGGHPGRFHSGARPARRSREDRHLRPRAFGRGAYKPTICRRRRTSRWATRSASRSSRAICPS